MKRERSPDQVMKLEAMSKARKTLRSLQEQIASRLIAMTEGVEELSKYLSDKQVAHFLHAACEMDVPEAAAYVKASKNLMDSRELLKDSRVGFPLLKSLATADSETRQEALARLREGATVRPRDVSAIRAGFKRQNLQWGEQEAHVAIRNARKFATARLKSAMSLVDQQVGQIMVDIDALSLQQDPVVQLTSADNIRAAAKSVLPVFEDVFGKQEYDPSETPIAAAQMKLAHAALLRVAEGKFGGEHGFTISDSGDDVLAILDGTDLGGCLQGATGTVRPIWAKTKRARKPYTRLPFTKPSVVELCAGAGGMALGLERAGYCAEGLYEFDKDAAATLRRNRPLWPVFEADIKTVDFKPYRERRIDLLVGGLPCQPYSTEGLGLGKDDPRDLLPEGARAVEEMQPAAFVFENVAGLLHAQHADHFGSFLKRLRRAGYDVRIIRMEAEDYGVPQERSRILVIGMRGNRMGAFAAPPRFPEWRLNLGDAIGDLMAENGWNGAAAWAEARRNHIVLKNGIAYRGVLASTVVGRKGGSREKEMARWAAKGLDIRNVADHAPTQAQADTAGEGFLPSLTLEMRARLQAFPDYWFFVGGKDSASRQIGNAVPPPIGNAIGLAVRAALEDVVFDYSTLLHPRTRHEPEERAMEIFEYVEPRAVAS